MKQQGILLLISLVTALPGDAWAHTGDRVFPIYELPTADLPDLHDGTIEDWEQVIPAASLDHNDLRTSSGQQGQPFDPEDLAVRVFLAWNNRNQRIYMAAEFIDDVAYVSESMQFMLDADHSGGEWNSNPQDALGLASGSSAQMYELYLHPRENLDPLYRGTAVSGWAYQFPWIDFGRIQFGEQPAQTIVEMWLTPWDLMGQGAGASVRSQLEGGRVIGFQLAFPDFDPELEDVYVIGDASVVAGGYRDNAGQFADGELIPCSYLDCSQAATVVTLDTWARIKASLQPGD